MILIITAVLFYIIIKMYVNKYLFLVSSILNEKEFVTNFTPIYVIYLNVLSWVVLLIIIVLMTLFKFSFWKIFLTITFISLFARFFFLLLPFPNKIKFLLNAKNRLYEIFEDNETGNNYIILLSYKIDNLLSNLLK